MITTARTSVGLGLIALLGAWLVASSSARAAERVSGNNGRHVIDCAPDGDGTVSILLYYDMEGLSGQNVITSIDFPRPEYFEARRLLTADVNAVIAGLFAGGADSVTVVDAHGSFNPEPDILLDEMDSRARMISRPARFDPYADLPETDTYDAVVAVAMHSRTGGGGFAEHTINLGTEWIFNEMSINESELLAYSWGRKGVPLILVSGDDRLAGQCAWMDWMEFVTVKHAVAIDSAALRPVDEVHDEMRAAARRAVQRLDRMKAVRLGTPIVATLHTVPPADLSILSRVPGLDYHDQAVTFEAADFREAYDGMRGLLAVAQSGYLNVAAEMWMGQGDEAFMQLKDAVFKLWIDAAKAPEPAGTPAAATGGGAASAPTSGKLEYFGAR